MLIKIFYLIIFFLYTQYFCLFYMLPSVFIKQNILVSNFLKLYNFPFLNYIYQTGFSKIYYKGNYVKTNKIDIIISNHINTLDFCLNSVLVKNFDNRNIENCLKEKFTYIPGIGFFTCFSNDIKLNRKIKYAKDEIIKTVKKLNNSVIIIMPEGTRFSNEKLKLSNEYSKKNNLQIFKNILYPKMKGLWTLIKTLIEDNKMGNLIDFTHSVPNFKNTKAELMKLITNDMGNTYTLIKTYNVPKDKSLNDYNNFKKWFLKIWSIKENNLELMNNNKILGYKILPINIFLIDKLHLIISIIIFIYIIYRTKGKIILYGNIILYLMVIIKNKLFYF